MNFTKQFMQENCGCYDLRQLNDCSFMATESITLESIIDSEIPLKDKFWFCCKKVFTKEQNQQIAILCAESVLHIYEDKYPNDDRPRKAIQAAKDYLKGNISIDDLIDARRAAYSAAAAAYDDAAAAAAYAAYSAYSAYSAAAYAAYDALQQTLLNTLKDFIKTNKI